MAELTGRELDAEVARVIFGYKVEWKTTWLSKEPYPYKPDEIDVFERAVRAYSTNMADAWLVVEKVRETAKIDMSIGDNSILLPEYKNHLTVTIKRTQKNIVVRSGTNHPTVICQAVLKAFEDVSQVD